MKKGGIKNIRLIKEGNIEADCPKTICGIVYYINDRKVSASEYLQKKKEINGWERQ